MNISIKWERKNGMNLYEKIMNREEKIAVVGLGYVGMPLAIEFAKEVGVIGFDNNKEKVEKYLRGIDVTNEVGNEALRATTVEFTWDEERLREAKFIIVAVPTPIAGDKTPNLTPVIKASEIIGRNLAVGSIVVYESTVYPGVTEDVCIPIIEKESGLKCGVDFKIGYSPERINPSDKIHTLRNIKKIVSGMDLESLDVIAKVYEIVIDAGVHRVQSIKAAEAAKVAENSQRDINIAFMNELAIVFDKMGIDTNEVIEAMNTKWNALGFKPGLVGGHCIGVDPYYFIYEAERLGYHSQIILAGRKINDNMGQFVADNIIKRLVLANKKVRESKVVILGVTFKENCPDSRNSKVVDIINRLREYEIEARVVDPVADFEEVKVEYKLELMNLDEIKDVDCIVFAVAHNVFRQITLEQLNKMFKKCPNKEKVIIDVKGMLDRKQIEETGYQYWSL